MGHRSQRCENGKKEIKDYFPLIPMDGLIGNGPAEYFRIDEGADGGIGIISSISNQFCQRCNRFRLTPDGYLRVCLGNEQEFDLKGPLRQGSTDSELKKIIQQALNYKPQGHSFGFKDIASRQMSAIGG